jgi:hypothetical protein
LLVLKLLLAPLAVWLASIASKRYGHLVGGVLSGFPMIAAPVTAALLIDHSAAQVSAIAFASASGLVATLGFISAFAWVARFHRAWWVCWLAAAAAFLGLAALLQFIALPLPVAVIVGCAAPWVARALMPRLAAPTKPPNIPASELILRLLGAFAMAAILILGAGQTAPWLSGLLIAWPITGSILPCFTQKLIGANATVALLSGFTRGLVGFSVFFVTLGLLLPSLHKAVAYAIALASAAAIAYLLARSANTSQTVRQTTKVTD